MKPVNQTKFVTNDGIDIGNCLQACIASIFELTLEEVPHFAMDDDWQEALDDFLDDYGFYHLITSVRDIENNRPVRYKGYHLLNGITNRTKISTHCVVAKNGKMIFDPHPSRAGLTEAQNAIIFVWKGE